MATSGHSALPFFHPLAMRMIRALHPAVGVPALRAFNLYLRRKSTYAVRTNRGFLIACSPRQLIQVCILQFGHWEPNVSSAIESLAREGACVVDIGANIGYDTLLMARKVGSRGRVVAFEAFAPTYAALRANIALNEAANIRAECLAISDEVGELLFYGGGTHNDGSASLMQGGGRAVAGRVRALPLHEALSADEVRDAEFMKIDVEGAEAGIMRGLVAHIERYENLHSILVEVSSGESAAWSGIWDDLHRLGFSAYLVDNDYAYAAYLRWRAPSPPMPIDALPDTQADVLFTKLDLAARGGGRRGE